MKKFLETTILSAGIGIFGYATAFAQPAAGVAAPASAPVAAADPAGQLSMPVPTTFTSKIGFFTMDQTPSAQYPRVIQLKNYAAGKGQLLATFSQRGPLPIYRSTDNGDTWQKFSEVPMLHGQPTLFELPQKAAEFQAGTIMAAGNGVPGADPSKRTLDVAYSLDGGATWKFLSTIAVGGGGHYDPSDRAGLLRDRNPVFEPYLYMDSTGHVVAYFSDERDKQSGYSQLLDHVVSQDGGRTWGPVVYDAAVPDGMTRPGMAIITNDNHGKYYMSYEEVSMPGYRSSRVGTPRIFAPHRWRQLGRSEKLWNGDRRSLAPVSQRHALYRMVAMGRP